MATKKPPCAKRPLSALPDFCGRFLQCFATTTVLESQIQHSEDSTASSWLCDKDGGSQKEDYKRQGQADSRNGIANQEVHILLDEGNHQQRKDSPNVNAPVEPVEETSGSFLTTVCHLQWKNKKQNREREREQNEPWFSWISP